MDENLVKQKMQGAIASLQNTIGTIRSGRATPTLIQNLEVSVYGGTQKLRILEVASVTTPDSQSLLIDPWDKSIIGEIKKGIEAANIGMNPNIDGEVIRISIPPLTTEDRERFVKLLSVKLEEAKVTVRQIRADAMHGIKKEFEDRKITEDEKFAFEKNLQTLTDDFTTLVDEMGEKKKSELMQL